MVEIKLSRLLTVAGWRHLQTRPDIGDGVWQAVKRKWNVENIKTLSKCDCLAADQRIEF